MFVEALNDQVRQFYFRLGFIPLKGDNYNSLFYLPTAIKQLFTVNNYLWGEQ